MNALSKLEYPQTWNMIFPHHDKRTRLDHRKKFTSCESQLAARTVWTVWSSFLMKYIAAYLLAQAGGDANPSQAKIISILESVGIKVDKDAVDTLLAKLSGKNVAELIESGAAQLSTVGGSGGASSGAGPAAAAAAEPAKEEKKEEEAVVELAGGFDDLFG
jgi:large subunit ribosomal protein LP2